VSQPRRTIAPPQDALLQCGAAELVRKIAVREVSCVEVFEAHRRRIEEVDPALNAIVVKRFDDARREAEAADRVVAAGRELGPLHGVPITVKECFHMPGTPSSIGLLARAKLLDNDESPLVTRLRAAGAIVLGKTNVPQLMMWHECDNPVYGRTNSPVDLDRSPGGSTGGEGAAIAAFCSPLGLGNDLGGSIRLPAAWNGITGIKPTAYRLTNWATTSAFRGQSAMNTQPGPLARNVEDCELALGVLAGNLRGFDVAPVPLGDSNQADIAGVRVAAWDDDGYFPACAAAKRAVREAARALEESGATVEWIDPQVSDSLHLYYAIMGADGGNDARAMARGSRLDSRASRILWMLGMSSAVRWSAVRALRLAGQRWMAHVVDSVGARSAYQYWQLCERLGRFMEEFHERVFTRGKFAALLTPPHALPALKHGAALDLLPAASYSFVMNMLGLPTGTVPWTTVRPEETVQRVTARDLAERRGEESLLDAAGLPIAVQVAAPAWHDHIVLQLMHALEAHTRHRTPLDMASGHETIK
jgi:fatty acid amide hydrolase